MAAITVGSEFSMRGLADHLRERLPPYAVPLFLRIQPEAETTGTYKFRKVELVKQGFDLSQIDDPIWFLAPGGEDFAEFDAAMLLRLTDGEYRL